MNRISRNERGIAMMVVLFSLLLLSVVGLGMMYSTNMETSINSNYRDKQDASYAALAGIQEARERIRISSYDAMGNPIYSVNPPFSLPSTAASSKCPNAGVDSGCIIYIVSDASKVKPWDPANAYYDSELCQEHVLGLTGTAGTACTGPAPSGSAWYQVWDDATSGAPWSLANPLSWKWTRIQLKANNNTVVPVNGNSANADQTCWNGVNEMSTPYGVSAGCKPTGGVSAIIVVTSGGGYTSTGPTVTIGGDGTGATVGTLDMQPEMTGIVSSITVTTGGSYTSAPTATIIGDGSGATANVILSSSGTVTTTPGAVTSLILTTGGAGYTTAPTVSFTGGGGSGATATATLSTTGTTTTTGYVNTITLSGGGSGYTSAPTVNFGGGGGGSGAAATATLGTSGEVVSVSVSSVGTQCYSSASDVVVTFSGGSGSGATATGTLETGRSCIYSVEVPVTNCTNQLKTPNGYTPSDQKSGVTLASVGNDSFSGTLFVQPANGKTPTSLTVQNPGYDATGYSSTSFTSTLELYNGGSGYLPWARHPAAGSEDCNNITVTATTGYRLASINVATGGSGYTSTPTVTISGGIGSTSSPAATATLGYPVTSLTLTGGGSGYTAIPTVSFTGGGGGCGVCTTATATDTIITTSTTTFPVASVTLTSGGLGYTGNPTVSFIGGGGSNAAANAGVSAASVTTYPVLSVTVSNGGSHYTTATVNFSGGGSTANAAATAAIGSMATGFYYVNAIPITNAGSGYTYDPPITISGSPGSGATAISQISGGTKFGNVWMLTSMAQTSTGARTMVQREVASPVLGPGGGGALTLDGPNPSITGMPSSTQFHVDGTDTSNTCGETPDAPHPAIDGYDDPNNPTTPSAVSTILGSLPRPDHYTGVGGWPSVKNGYDGLGPTLTTPTGLNQLITNTTNTALSLGAALGGNVYTGTPANVTDADIALGSCPTHNIHDASCHTVIDVVQGNLTLNGSPSGYGILIVEGTLTMGGDFTWYGPVYVIGDGIAHMNGGGTGSIVGQLLIAKMWNGDNVHYPSTSLLGTHDVGTPTISWVGGGNNGVQYDHCWSSDLWNQVHGLYSSTDAYKILSDRMMSY
jgi:hypothetical protein